MQLNFLTRFFVLTTIFLGMEASFASTPKKQIPTELGTKVVSRYVEIVRATYKDTVLGAKELRQKIETLVQAPSAESLKAAREAWKRARDVYGPTESFRFYGGPIDDPKNGPEGLINAWPMDEAYVDYVKGNDAAGIINMPTEYPQITKELLLSLNEKNGEKNISTGYHAIEFLLWGQDLSANGPGNRSYEDFVVGKGKNAERRGLYVRLLAEILEDHLTQVAKLWDVSNPENYGEKLKKEPLDESLRRIYTGLVTLSIDEMAGERMTVALEKNDQEHEQDCFSDYTLKGMVSNEIGIHNVYFGRYGATTGPGLHDLVLATDAKQATATKKQLEKTMAQIKAIPGTFDRVVTDKKSKGRKAAKDAIFALETQARSIAKSGLEMGLMLNIQ